MSDKIKEAITAIKEENFSKGVEILQAVIKERADAKITESKEGVLSFHNFLVKEKENPFAKKEDGEKEDDKDDSDDEDGKKEDDKEDKE